MQNWEYKAVQLGLDLRFIEARLNGYGAEGWELVSTSYKPDDGSEPNVINEAIVFVLKRPIATE